MEDILIVHRKSNINFECDDNPQIAVFKTCLRKILFCYESDFDSISHLVHSDDHVLKGEMALSLLLEIICGLHSPIIGETEILGQFKNFVDSRRLIKDQLFSENQKWLQFVTAEGKRVRSEHLVGIGSHSYGSLLRKHSKEIKSFSILGTGHLAQEILPWVHQKEVQLICRTPQKAQSLVDKYTHPIQVTKIDECKSLMQALVIAAPIEDEVILNLVQHDSSNVIAIYDLRGEANNLGQIVKAQYSHIQIVDLKQFFAEIEETKRQHQNIVIQIKQYILDKALSFIQRTEIHPMGWDDLCA